MKLERHVTSAIDDFGLGKPDAALMHACFAIEGTAAKLFGRGKAAYKRCLRQYCWIIEPMLGSGIDIAQSRWTNLSLGDGFGAVIESPDLADIVYHVFRCSHAHGEDVPDSFSLLPTQNGISQWLLAKDHLSMPDLIIWALLAVSVFSKANKDIVTKGDYFLTWGNEPAGLGIHKFLIREWWGREEDFRAFISQFDTVRVKMAELERLRLNVSETSSGEGQIP